MALRGHTFPFRLFANALARSNRRLPVLPAPSWRSSLTSSLFSFTTPTIDGPTLPSLYPRNRKLSSKEKKTHTTRQAKRFFEFIPKTYLERHPLPSKFRHHLQFRRCGELADAHAFFLFVRNKAARLLAVVYAFSSLSPQHEDDERTVITCCKVRSPIVRLQSSVSHRPITRAHAA